jgi:hypothetical protein
MTKKKISATAAPMTAAGARKLVKSNVASPYNHGIDRVDRVIDTIDAMFARRQIDGQQKRAADTYRDAFDVVVGAGLGGAMDFDRVRGGGSPGAPPGPAAMVAAQTLDDAKKTLGTMDSAIVELVVGRGYSIEQAAARVLSSTATKKSLSVRDTEFVGKRMRDALSALAEHWHPVSRKTHIRSFMEEGAKPVGGEPGIREGGACRRERCRALFGRPTEGGLIRPPAIGPVGKPTFVRVVARDAPAPTFGKAGELILSPALFHFAVSSPKCNSAA